MAEREATNVPRWAWWAGFFAVVGAGLYFTTLAYVEGLPEAFNTIRHFDKGAHFVFAGMLAFFLDGALCRRMLRAPGSHARIAVPLSAVVILVPAAVEEYLQRYATFRTSSIWDFAADVAGVIAFIPLSRRFAK